MAKITYTIKDRRIEIDNLSTQELVSILRRMIKARAPLWRENMLSDKEGSSKVLTEGPLYYAERTLLWNAITDSLDNREVDSEALYFLLLRFSSDCIMGRDV